PCVRRCSDRLTVPVRLPACPLSSHFVRVLSRIELLRTLHPGWKSLDELERYFQTAGSHPIQDPRPDARGREPSKHPALGIQPGAGEPKDVLYADDVLFHAGDLADLDHLAAAITHPFQMDDDVERAGYLGANRSRNQVVAGHHHQRLEPRQRVP